MVEFPYFTKVRRFGKRCFIDGRMGVWIVKGKHAGYGNEGRTRVEHWNQMPEESGSLGDIFLFVKGQRRIFLQVSFLCFYEG